MKKKVPASSCTDNNCRLTCFFFIAPLMIMISLDGLGQKVCSNPPTVNLGSTSGTTCFTESITVTDNNFGGSATQVTISTDGHGSINPASASSSPFSFTYIPGAGDSGHTVTITVTTNNPLRSPCKAAKATYSLAVMASLSAPNIDNIVQPTCTLSTGTVQLSGLPSSSAWLITANPTGMTLAGNGTTAAFDMLSAGTYTFSVSVSSGCSSSASGPAVINEQPMSPSPPLPGSISAPACTTLTGSVTMVNLPSQGTWTLIRYPGTVTTTGTGTSALVSGLTPGIFNFAVTNAAGCESALSLNVIIPSPPPVPSAPVIDTIIQPTPKIPSGSVTLTGLPSSGAWTITQLPGDVIKTGSGTFITISGLQEGSYTFKVKNDYGCSSAESNSVLIAQPAIPIVVISDPSPVCFPGTVDLTSPEITAGSTTGLSFTYWADASASHEFKSPESAPAGIYYIKGTTGSGYFDIKPVTVTVVQSPVANAGRDQTLAYQTTTTLGAELGPEETGTWFADSGNVVFGDAKEPNTEVSNLSTGNNVLRWIVTNNVCPADTDAVTITVGGLIIPTLITPNGDSKNEYFIIPGIESIGKSDLKIFDRRGRMVFQNADYDNKWNGVDYNSSPLANDTYFFVLKSVNGKSFTGYIMIRR